MPRSDASPLQATSLSSLPADDALRKSLAQFAALFSAMTELVVLHDLVLDEDGRPRDYRITDCNPAFETITGIPRRQAVGHLASEVYGAVPPPYLDIYARAALSGEPHVFETYYPPMDKHFLVSVACLEKGRFATITTDITAQKKAEDALRANQRLLSTAGRTARFGGWSASPDGGDIVWSDQVALIHEREPGFVPTLEQAIAHYAPSCRGRIARVFAACASHGAPYDEELVIITAGGKEVWVRTTGEALRDEAGNIVRIQGSFQDITEHKRAEAQLQLLNTSLEQLVTQRTGELSARTAELEEANRRLRELDEVKSAIITTVTHELRTPLTSILGFATVTGRKFEQFLAGVEARDDPAAAPSPARTRPLAETIAGNLRIIEDQGRRLARLINDFLDLNRIESGELAWREDCIDPVQALQRAARAAEGGLFHRPGLRLELDVPATLPVMRLDPDRFDQLVLNLLHNAIKFTPAGVIRLAARWREEALLLCVEDQGVGIPRDELRRIFDTFHQVRHAHGQRLDEAAGHGTGLGLAICRQIVAHYDGVIWAESDPGQGTSFRVELPASPSADCPQG